MENTKETLCVLKSQSVPSTTDHFQDGNRTKLHTLALVAHDGKKTQMLAFVKDNGAALLKFNLIATATTGALITKAGFKVECMLSGPLGGDAQIAALASTGQCNGVIFLRDPLGMHPHGPDISTLMRICDVHNVPLATNLATASLLIRGLSNKLTFYLDDQSLRMLD